MYDKYYIIKLCLVLGFLGCQNDIQQSPNVTSQSPTKVSYRIVSVKEGFGYDLLLNDSVFIRQTQIPSVVGIKAFKTEGDAKKVAELVIQKLTKDIFPPSVSSYELDSLKISY